MSDPFRYAFIDESGSVAALDQNHLLIVAALSTDHAQSVTRIVRRAQKKIGSTRPIGELKAKKTGERNILQFLINLSKEPIELFVVVIDRQSIKHPPKDAEDIYRWAVSRVVAMLVERYSRVEVVLDKRYTKESLRYKLEKSIRSEIINIPQQYVLIRQEDSAGSKGLQAVDFIAWSFLQKYEHDDCQYYNVFSQRIVVEEYITKLRWDTTQRR